MQGQYRIERRVADLPEGYEYQSNRFITDKSDAGAYVTYKSQDGSTQYLYNFVYSINSKVWFDANQVISCVVDFVPNDFRDEWTQLQKLGKCYLEFLPYDDGAWQVTYPENHDWTWGNGNKGDYNLSDHYDGTLALAIENSIRDFNETGIVHNGHRWFDCRDITDFKKISDDEAKKLMNENN